MTCEEPGGARAYQHLSSNQRKPCNGVKLIYSTYLLARLNIQTLRQNYACAAQDAVLTPAAKLVRVREAL